MQYNLCTEPWCHTIHIIVHAHWHYYALIIYLKKLGVNVFPKNITEYWKHCNEFLWRAQCNGNQEFFINSNESKHCSDSPGIYQIVTTIVMLNASWFYKGCDELVTLSLLHFHWFVHVLYRSPSSKTWVFPVFWFLFSLASCFLLSSLWFFPSVFFASFTLNRRRDEALEDVRSSSREEIQLSTGLHFLGLGNGQFVAQLIDLSHYQ